MPIHGHPALPEVAVGAVAVSSAPPNEVCFNSADEMRVHAVRGGWRLVDEGSAKKGVQKLGWLSTQPGDEIDFVSVPIANPNAKQAAHSPVCNTARLGYLLTTVRPQGAFHISCVGSCACSGVSRATSFWVKASRSQSGVFPFPRISTDANKYLSKFNAEHQLGRIIEIKVEDKFAPTMLAYGDTSGWSPARSVNVIELVSERPYAPHEVTAGFDMLQCGVAVLPQDDHGLRFVHSEDTRRCVERRQMRFSRYVLGPLPHRSLEFSLEAWSDAAHMGATFESAQLTPSAMFEARPAA